MNLIQAGFDMLCILAMSDGHFDEREYDVISDFLQANYEGEFDIQAELQLLMVLSEKGLGQRLAEAAHYVDNSTAMENKLKLLDFGIELTAADGKVTEEEIGIFAAITEIWGIDLDRYLDAKFS